MVRNREHFEAPARRVVVFHCVSTELSTPVKVQPNITSNRPLLCLGIGQDRIGFKEIFLLEEEDGGDLPFSPDQQKIPPASFASRWHDVLLW